MAEIVSNLFVYGTLMPDYPNYWQIERFVIDHQKGTIDGVLVDLGTFPALMRGDGIVKGTVLRVNQEALEITDRIEDYHPDQDHCLYMREETTVRTKDGQQIVAWTYVYANPNSVADQPRLAVGAFNGVPLHAWSHPDERTETRKRGESWPTACSNAGNDLR